MRQFLYLDTDIVNSIIAQQGKGLVDVVTTEKESGNDESTNQSIDVEAGGGAGAKVWKLANAEAKLTMSGSLGGASTNHETTKEIIAKTLHDASFDVAYDAIKPTMILPGNDAADPGAYIEMSRVFDFVDLNYLEKLLSKDGIVGLLSKSEKEKIQKEAEDYKDNNMNREQRRQGNKAVSQKVNDLLKQCDQKYDEIHEIIAALRKIIPFGRMLVSSDGYLIPTEDKYYRINPATLGFMYGGEIKCVGMITNVIGKDTNTHDSSNIFATLQLSLNDVLRNILQTNEDDLYVISPIAIYYEN